MWCTGMIFGCTRMTLCFTGMINGETEGDEATRAVVKAAKAVAGGSSLCYIVNTRGSFEHCYFVTLYYNYNS